MYVLFDNSVKHDAAADTAADEEREFYRLLDGMLRRRPLEDTEEREFYRLLDHVLRSADCQFLFVDPSKAP